MRLVDFAVPVVAAAAAGGLTYFAAEGYQTSGDQNQQILNCASHLGQKTVYAANLPEACQPVEAMFETATPGGSVYDPRTGSTIDNSGGTLFVLPSASEFISENYRNDPVQIYASDAKAVVFKYLGPAAMAIGGAYGAVSIMNRRKAEKEAAKPQPASDPVPENV